MKKALIAGLALLLISQASFASSRMVDVYSHDVDTRLSDIAALKKNIRSAQFELSTLEVRLGEEQRKERRGNTTAKIAKISGAVAVASLTALFLVRVGPKALETPAVVKLTSMTALLSSLTAVTSGTVSFYTFDQATEVRRVIKAVIEDLEDNRLQLNREISLLCRDQPQHKECY